MIDASQLPAVQALSGTNAGRSSIQQMTGDNVATLVAKPEYTYVGIPRAREHAAQERIRQL
jgi:hypothetical protein